MSSLALAAPRRGSLLPYLGVAVVAAAMLGPAAAFAGTDASFNTALTQFTNFLSGSGGKVITVLSLAGGLRWTSISPTTNRNASCASATA